MREALAVLERLEIAARDYAPAAAGGVAAQLEANRGHALKLLAGVLAPA